MPHSSPKLPSTPTTPTSPGGGPYFKFTDPDLNRKAATVKDQLLQWCQMKTKEYEVHRKSNHKILSLWKGKKNNFAGCCLCFFLFLDFVSWCLLFFL
jgi:hypothetical protein